MQHRERHISRRIFARGRGPRAGTMVDCALLICMGGAIAPLLGGCTSGKPAAPVDQAAVFAAARPEIVAPGADGLETLWWVADDTAGAVGRRLTPYVGAGSDVDPAQQERLRGMGLRAVSVPIGELEAIRTSMTAAGPTQRRWLGQVPQWTVLVEGSNWPAGLVVSIGGEETQLDPGRLRWLVRAWTTPVTRVDDNGSHIGAALTVEIMPQMQDARPRFERLLEEAAEDGALTIRSTGPDRDGPLIERAMLPLVLASGHALLLVPESPDVDWLAAMEPSDQTGRTSPEQGGPGKPEPTTLGEAMLAQDTAVGGRIKVIVALIPRVPDRFKLIGP